MNKYRWIILVSNLILMLAIITLGFYFFGGLSVIMQRVLGFDEKHSPDLYFKDIPIPTWTPSKFRPQKKTEIKRRTIEHDYPSIGRAYTPEPDKQPETQAEVVKPPEAQILLEARLKQVHSVVYSSTNPELSGCYLQIMVAGAGEKVFYFAIGDLLPDLGDNVQFALVRVEEIEKDRKYRVVFKDAQSREAYKEFVKSMPPTFNIESMIKK